MAEKTLEERVSFLEAQLENRTLEQHFREQAELIDRLLVYRFEGLGKKWDAKLDIDARLKPVRADLAIVKHAMGVLLTRVT